MVAPQAKKYHACTTFTHTNPSWILPLAPRPTLPRWYNRANTSTNTSHQSLSTLDQPFSDNGRAAGQKVPRMHHFHTHHSDHRWWPSWSHVTYLVSIMCLMHRRREKVCRIGGSEWVTGFISHYFDVLDIIMPIFATYQVTYHHQAMLAARDKLDTHDLRT